MNEQSFDTLLHWGIIGTDSKAVQSYYDNGWSPGSYVTFDSLPLMGFPDYDDRNGPTNNPYYISYVPETEILRPQNAYRNVVKVTAGKAANDNNVYINFKDASDNIVFSTQTDPNLAVVTAGGLNVNYTPLTLGIAVADQGGGIYSGVVTLFSNISSFKKAQYPTLSAFNYGITWNYSGDVDDWLQGQLDGKYYTGTPGGPGGEAGPSGSPSGGDGLYTMPDYDIPHPALPALDPADSGFMSLYKMSAAQLQALANDLWDSNFFNSLAKHFSDPFDNIISLGIVPYGLTGTLQQVTICDYQCPTSGEKLSACYYQLNCGTIYMKHYFAHFGDYQIKFDLYLPYCGTVSLDPSEIMDGSLNVQYNFDVFSGSCLATVRCMYEGGTSHVLYSKEGNIRTEVPISGRDFTEYYKALISGVAVVAGGGAIGIAGLAGVGGAIGSLAASMGGAGMIAQGAENLVLNKPAYQRSGNISGPAGYMGIQYPYLIATIPNYFGGPEIGDKCGYVSNLPCRIGDESGYLQCEVDFEELSGIDAPGNILEGIKQDLAEGIYIEEVL